MYVSLSVAKHTDSQARHQMQWNRRSRSRVWSGEIEAGTKRLATILGLDYSVPTRSYSFPARSVSSGSS